ncbi:MAG: TonB-dependent receptor family protein [Prevotellaceae bacterium]|jgi:outer membrane receptor protein involved in Fe transport|nr:TonB-dependent receptor family protein [Prevotellaceae bacterium]
MKNLLLTLCLWRCALNIQAQQPAGTPVQTGKFIIQGNILDALDDETIPFATVKIFSGEQSQKPLQATVTDGDGKFRETINQKGNYLLSVEFIGKKSVRIPFSTGDKPVIDFGIIKMDDDAQQLEEVVVSAQKVLVKVDLDKITYSMEDDPEAAANNVLDMMRKVPMVTLDGDENVQLKGATDFKYYINGKPAMMLDNNASDVLRSMPANTVQTIEVITDPGAKYDAEGVAGIINIVTKKQSSLGGYTATITANGAAIGASGAVGTAYLSLKYGKIGFTGSLSAGKVTFLEDEQYSFREDYTNATHHYLNQDGRSKLRNDLIRGYGEWSYEIDTFNLLTVSFNRSHTNRLSDAATDVLMRSSSYDTTYQYFQQRNLTQESGNTSAGVDYQHLFLLPNRLFTASYRFNRSSADVMSDNTVTGYLHSGGDRNKQYSNGSIDEHTFQLDYTTPIYKIHTVETGIKYIRRINGSTSGLSRLAGDTWTPVFSDRDRFRHTQDIAAAYAGYSVKYKQWGVKTGVRFEGTWLNAAFPTNGAMNFEAKYTNLIPSGLFTYRLSPAQILRGSYAMRLSRPDISLLNPYRNTSDSLYIQYGNPSLQAVKYHTFDLGYNYFNSKFSANINLTYNQTNNAVNEDTWIEDGISYSTYKNIANAKRFNLAILTNYSLTPKHRIYFNVRGNYADLRSNENGDIHRTGYGGSISAGSQHTLPYDFRFNIVLDYSAPAISLQSTAGDYFFHNFTLSKSFLDKKLTVRAVIYNPFIKKLDFTTTRETSDFYYHVHNYRYRSRRIEVTASYSFGEMKEKIKKVQRRIVNDDAMENPNPTVEE